MNGQPNERQEQAGIQMEKFEQLKRELLEILEKSAVIEDPAHAQIVHKWVLKLKPDADEALQISALSHDIDRAISGIMESGVKFGPEYDEFKKAHALRSAQYISEILRKYAYPEETIQKVHHLVANHEFGGDEETDILRNADSLAYFEYNIPFYLESNGRERTKEKIKFMYRRIPPEAQDLVRGMKFSDKNIDELFQETMQELG